MAPQDDLTAERAEDLYGSIRASSDGFDDDQATDDLCIEMLRQALKTARREALQGQRELLQRLDAHLDTMMGDGSGLPFQTFLTQTALLRWQVKAALDRLASEGG